MTQSPTPNQSALSPERVREAAQKARPLFDAGLCNYPVPRDDEYRVVGFKLPADVAGLSDGLFMAEAARDVLRNVEPLLDALTAAEARAEKATVRVDELAEVLETEQRHSDALQAKHDRLRERLERVESAIKYAADVRWLELAQGSGFGLIDRQMLGELYALGQAALNHQDEAGKS